MKVDSRTIIDIGQDPGLHRNPIVFKPKKLPVDIPKFHWVADKPDKRDFIYTLQPTPKNKLVDLRPFCTPVENQGNLGSCTGQAIAGAIELLNNKVQRYRDISRLFIYYFNRTFINTVDYDSGAYIRDGIKTCFTYGACLENLWPYDISKFRIRPNSNAMSDALRRKITRYERVLNFDGCINALDNGFPIIVGYYVYSSFMSSILTRTGMMPYPNTRIEKLLGGHAVLLVGYDTRRSVFIARNSWGNKWGDKGYFYMPFEVIKNEKMSGDFWIIKSVNNP